MTEILVPTSPGELIDKLTILRLKSERVTDEAKLKNIRHELQVLQEIADQTLLLSEKLTGLWNDLYEINTALWEIEDDIRACELAQNFGEKFISLARAVYVTNDQRADVKKMINLLLGSVIVEEKSYHKRGKT